MFPPFSTSSLKSHPFITPPTFIITSGPRPRRPLPSQNLSTITSTPKAAAPFAGLVGFRSARPPSSPAPAPSIMGSRKRGGLPSGAPAAGDGIKREVMAAAAEFEVKGNGGGVGSAGLMTLPTVLTLGRVAAVPILISTFYMNGWWATTATTGIFIAAAITDWLDGYLARKMQLGTVFGAFLDPVADKLMVAATLVLLCTKPLEVSVFGEVHWLLTAPSIAIIGREITMSAVREWAASQNSKLLEAVAVNSLGKWKTATQMTALTILLATRDPSLAWPDFVVASGVVLLYISAGLALWSLAVYMRKIWRVLLK